MRAYRAGAAVCRACPAFGTCTKDAHKGRLIEISQENPVLVAHRALMATARAKGLYARRKELVEPVFGIVKEQQGLRRFLLRCTDADPRRRNACAAEALSEFARLAGPGS